MFIKGVNKNKKRYESCPAVLTNLLGFVMYYYKITFIDRRLI